MTRKYAICTAATVSLALLLPAGAAAQTRSDQARNRSGGGFGLGLSIAKWIVESHGGRIAVQSPPGDGATFTASFPQSSGALAAPGT